MRPAARPASPKRERVKLNILQTVVFTDHTAVCESLDFHHVSFAGGVMQIGCSYGQATKGVR